MGSDWIGFGSFVTQNRGTGHGQIQKSVFLRMGKGRMQWVWRTTRLLADCPGAEELWATNNSLQGRVLWAWQGEGVKA